MKTSDKTLDLMTNFLNNLEINQRVYARLNKNLPWSRGKITYVNKRNGWFLVEFSNGGFKVGYSPNDLGQTVLMSKLMQNDKFENARTSVFLNSEHEEKPENFTYLYSA